MTDRAKALSGSNNESHPDGTGNQAGTRRFTGRQALGIAAGIVSLAVVWGGWQSRAEEYLSGKVWPEPALVSLEGGDQVPSDAVVLFGGEDLSAWEGGDQWSVANGVATAAGGGITSKQTFGSCQLHLEFACPAGIEGSGQGRGNSGVYLMGHYEVQILDSYENETYFDGQCGAIYKQHPPLVNACRKPGEWQSYDIIFTAPKFRADGSLESPAAITVLHNGVLIQNHFELEGGTSWDMAPAYTSHADKLPMHIQFHGNPVKFRNIWIREL